MILYGASGHAKVIIDILEANGVNIDYIVDDNPLIRELLGYEVRRNSGVYDEALIAIGSNEIRHRIVQTITVGRYVTAVHPTAVVSPRAGLGCGTAVMQGAIIQSSARVGNHCIINTGAVVEHDCMLSDFVHVAPNATLAGNVCVGERTWIGAGTVVRQGIAIGADCVIGAGAVVIKDVPDRVVMAGVPAKILRYKTQ